MPKILGMSIIINNRRVSELLPKEVMEKLCEKWRFFIVLLIKNGYVIIAV